MLIVLLVLYVGSQLLSSVLMSVTADRNQRFIMIALPFVFVPFIHGFPAGLLVYWITTNLWTVGQQYIIRRRGGLAGLGAPGQRARAGAGGGARDKDRERPKPRSTDKAKAGANGDDAAPRAASSTSAGERPAPAAPPAARRRTGEALMSRATSSRARCSEVLEEVVDGARARRARSRSTATATS